MACIVTDRDAAATLLQWALGLIGRATFSPETLVRILTNVKRVAGPYAMSLWLKHLRAKGAGIDCPADTPLMSIPAAAMYTAALHALAQQNSEVYIAIYSHDHCIELAWEKPGDILDILLEFFPPEVLSVGLDLVSQKIRKEPTPPVHTGAISLLTRYALGAYGSPPTPLSTRQVRLIIEWFRVAYPQASGRTLWSPGIRASEDWTLSPAALGDRIRMIAITVAARDQRPPYQDI